MASLESPQVDRWEVERRLHLGALILSALFFLGAVVFAFLI